MSIFVGRVAVSWLPLMGFDLYARRSVGVSFGKSSNAHIRLMLPDFRNPLPGTQDLDARIIP